MSINSEHKSAAVAMENSVLAVLASKEKTIEALRRELAEKEQREGKLKGQVLKLRALIQPLRDELVNQKEERKEEMLEKRRFIDKLKEEVATVEMKLKEMKKTKEEVEKVKRSKRTLTVGDSAGVTTRSKKQMVLRSKSLRK